MEDEDAWGSRLFLFSIAFKEPWLSELCALAYILFGIFFLIYTNIYSINNIYDIQYECNINTYIYYMVRKMGPDWTSVATLPFAWQRFVLS